MTGFDNSSPSLQRILARISEPSTRAYIANPQMNIYGQLAQALAAEFDLVWEAAKGVQPATASTATKAAPATQAAPATPAKPAAALPTSVAAVTDSEAEALGAWMREHFGFEGQGKGRLVSDIMVVIQELSARVQTHEGFARAVVSRLQAAFGGDADTASTLDPLNATAALMMFIETREQIAEAASRVIGTVKTKPAVK